MTKIGRHACGVMMATFARRMSNGSLSPRVGTTPHVEAGTIVTQKPMATVYLEAMFALTRLPSEDSRPPSKLR